MVAQDVLKYVLTLIECTIFKPLLWLMCLTYVNVQGLTDG